MTARALMATHDPGDRLDLPGEYWLRKQDDNAWELGWGNCTWLLKIVPDKPCGHDGSIDQEIDDFVRKVGARASVQSLNSCPLETVAEISAKVLTGSRSILLRDRISDLELVTRFLFDVHAMLASRPDYSPERYIEAWRAVVGTTNTLRGFLDEEEKSDAKPADARNDGGAP